jgi:hypothetical protein
VVEQAGPKTVIMLPARVESSDPAAAVVTDAVRQSTLRNLRAMPNVQVVEISPAEIAAIVPPNAGTLGDDNLVYLTVTSRYEGRVVAEIAETTAADSQFWAITLRLRAPNGGGSSSGGVGKDGTPRPGGDAESLGVRYAERIARYLDRETSESMPLSRPGPTAADARSVLMDTTRSETERLQALSQLARLIGALDSAAIAAAVDIATRSPAEGTRQRAWNLLRRNAFDPTLAPPLSYALLSDANAAVRKEAALGLAAYPGDSTAAAALQHALRNDSSSEVRLAARMATMNFDGQQAFKRETLLDRSLTPAERLAPMMVDSNFRMMGSTRFSGTSVTEETLAFAEIAVAIEDPALKIRSLSELQRTMSMPIRGQLSADESRIVDALIQTSRHTDDGVRRLALQVLTSLTQMSGNAEGRAVLASVLENEPGLAAELNISQALEDVARRPPLPVPTGR